MYRYNDFRDASQRTFAAGSEPLYRYNATVVQALFTAWF
jgi:hypothetical protein